MGRASVQKSVGEGAQVVIADMQDAKGQQLQHELGDDAVYHAKPR